MPIPQSHSTFHDPSVDWPCRFRQLAVVGFVFWALTAGWQVVWGGPSVERWAAALFLLAPLVLVPLGLAIIATPSRIARLPRVWAGLNVSLLPAAILLSVSFSLQQGVWAGAEKRVRATFGGFSDNRVIFNAISGGAVTLCPAVERLAVEQ